jgi:hypothetical protein
MLLLAAVMRNTGSCMVANVPMKAVWSAAAAAPPEPVPVALLVTPTALGDVAAVPVASAPVEVAADEVLGFMSEPMLPAMLPPPAVLLPAAVSEVAPVLVLLHAVPSIRAPATRK